MKFTIITLFPNIVQEYINTSIISNAIKKDILQVEVVDLRNFGKGKRRNTDDTVYGGGTGMVLTVPVLDKALSSINLDNAKIIYLSPKGRTFTQNVAKEYAQNCEHIVLICGHYEGVDERIFKLYNIYEVSIGDYVLTGGELPALAILDSVARLIPGVLKQEAVSNETFEAGLLEEAQYTKPLEYKGLKVPDILVSGNHELVNEYRLEDRIYTTYLKRPDMLKKYIEHNKLNTEKIKQIVAKKEGKQNGYN